MQDLNDAVLTCAVSIAWSNDVGVPGRKLNYRSAQLRLTRSDLREIFIEISTDKVKPTKYKLKNIMIHKKFMNEGKASINFKSDNCTMYLSNAPPSNLMLFLRTMFIKLNGGTPGSNGPENDAELHTKLRAHMLSGKPSTYEEISPVTTAQMVLARKRAGFTNPASPSTTITTSSEATKKRRFDELKQSGSDGINAPPAAKKLYGPTVDAKSSSSLCSVSSTKSNATSSSAVSLAMSETSVPMCSEQLEVLRACTSGKSVFFTGSAGTGKSFLLRRIISALPPDGTVATASTGVAACLIGGVTLHAFAGIGSGEGTMQRCLDLAGRPASAQTWRKCKRLIIDEISMVDGEYFEKIEAVARHIRRNERPFGGIQLILCGDFLQLPPVQKRDAGNIRFCFQSRAWDQCIQVVYELKEVHRQSDAEFVRILNHVRIGHVNEEMANRLMSTSRQKIESDGILATQLCSHTNDANSINESKLDNLPGEKILFSADDSDAKATKQIDSQVQAPGKLYLKENAQVMLLKNVNISSGLVNGARGVVLRIERGVPIVRFKSIEYACKPEKWIIKMPNGGVMTRMQVPLKLAWAFSIHKSQGLTLDCVEMSLSKVFEAGQAYVALSRAKSLESVRVLDFDTKQVWANPHVLQFYKLFRRRLHDITMIPLGGKNRTTNTSKDKEQQQALTKLKKSILKTPLVSIC